MARTLGHLKQSIDRLISEQGVDAPCAAWIYTKQDVIDYDENFNEIPVSDEIVDDVLNEVEEMDYIYELIIEYIEGELKRIKRIKHTVTL